ncbi:hypothetical protein FRC02_003397 [Tulasnella sp. 418]|nr:hypothetical protein FRC02_003397 [Tulasnella sp. 418]
MSNSSADASSLPHRDLGLVFVFDSSIATVAFWSRITQYCIVPMMQKLTRSHISQKYALKLRVGLVVYTRSDTKPSLLYTQYFTGYDQFSKDLQEGLADINGPNSIGLGRTTSAPTVGMSVLEGLVTGVEMIEHLFAEAAQQPLSPSHPNIPPAPKKLAPIAHLILIASSPPGGPRYPLENSMSKFDDVTLETLPSEILQRNIHFSLLSPIQIPELVSFHNKTTAGAGPDKLFFKEPPAHWVIMLSGYSEGDDAGAMRRTPSNANSEVEAKKALTESPQAQIRGTPGGQVSTPQSDFKPPASDVVEASPQTLFRTPNAASAPTPTSSQEQLQKTQEYQRSMIQAQLSQQISGPATTPASSQAATPAPSAAMPVLSQANVAINNTPRPPSQPQHTTPQIQPQIPITKSHVRSQSDALPHPSQVPNTNQTSPTIQLRTPKQRGETAPAPSPRQGPTTAGTSASHMNEALNNQGFSAAPPSIPQQLPTLPGGANAAYLQQLAVNNNRMLQQAQNSQQQQQQQNLLGDNQMLQRQKLLAAHMSAQGVLPGSSLVGAAPEASTNVIDIWQGPLVFNFPDAQNPSTPRAKHIWVSARSLQPRDRPGQFALWPTQLAFTYFQFRVIDHVKISTFIKEKTIPLCLFNPNNGKFEGNAEAAAVNEKSYRELVALLANKQAVYDLRHSSYHKGH